MHRWKPTLFLVGTVLAGWALYWVVTFSGSPQVPPPELYIEPAVLDIGSVWDTDRYVHSLSITNRSSQPVTITGWYRSCECRSIEPERFGFHSTAIDLSRTDAFRQGRNDPRTVGVLWRQAGAELRADRVDNRIRGMSVVECAWANALLRWLCAWLRVGVAKMAETTEDI
ncbi:MAG: hypothetical protein KatS3mg110_0732 [Pirellulaceae bacterium]|nr:MAG: hypothetical protein KatS3mg110_0732 [Pirellulaceae bacterium]